MATNTKTARKDILNMSYFCEAGHIPSALSHIDYIHYMFTNDGLVDRNLDKVIVGKPYGAQAYYVVFREMGLLTYEDLLTFKKTNSPLSYGITNKAPYITFAEDTLGSAVGIGCGLSISLLTKEVPGVVMPIVWINISDSVLQCGTTWEAIMFAGAKELHNIIMTVDYNNTQCTGCINDIMPIEPLKNKFESFRWHHISASGHDEERIEEAFDKAMGVKGKPTVIVFHTMKGKGIKFMEREPVKWHYRCLNEQELLEGLEQVENS